MTNLSPSSDQWSTLSRQQATIELYEPLAYGSNKTSSLYKCDKQLEIFELPQSDPIVSDHLTEIVSDTDLKINPELIQPEPQEPPPGTVNLYFPGRRNTPYYRFSYRNGRRTKHVHIRGGNYANPEARANADTIRAMVNRRAALDQILAQIAKF